MFNYTCEECGKGVVKKKVLEDYRTKIRGRPFVVDKAVVGVCDHCGARHFDATETKRWENLFNRELEEKNLYLSSEEIAGIRKLLGLSIENFAYLLGCTRQSIHNWERKDREKPQSRMADLLIKLVRDSARDGKVDVVRFLVEEANKVGTPVRLIRSETVSNGSIRLELKKVPRKYLESYDGNIQLAAAEHENEVLIAESPSRDLVGFIRYDFSSGNLSFDILRDEIGLELVDIKVTMSDEKQFSQTDLVVERNRIILVPETAYRDRDLTEILIEPKIATSIGKQE